MVDVNYDLSLTQQFAGYLKVKLCDGQCVLWHGMWPCTYRAG